MFEKLTIFEMKNKSRFWHQISLLGSYIKVEDKICGKHCFYHAPFQDSLKRDRMKLLHKTVDKRMPIKELGSHEIIRKIKDKESNKDASEQTGNHRHAQHSRGGES